MSESRVYEVVNMSLSAVAFVHDYVEFHFDGKVLRVFTGPAVICNGKKIDVDEAGWRDALCDLIGAQVRDLAFLSETSSHLKICFANDSALIVRLAASAKTGPEALHYVPGDNEPIEVW